jgi:hypothetical protein
MCQPCSSPGMVRSTQSFSSGLLYWEAQLGFTYAGADDLIGIANANESLGNWVGESQNSVGWWWSTGQIYQNDATTTTIETGAPGTADVMAFALDLTHSKLWIKNLSSGSGWNNDIIGNQNPATNTGGYSFSGLNAGPYFLAQSFNDTGDYSVLNTGGSPFVGTPPAGFSAVGANITWNPNDKSANLTVVAPISTIAGASNTYAAWQALGYDAHGLNAQPVFANAAANNFALVPGSPGIKAGLSDVTISGVVTTDILGQRRIGGRYDMGAYQWLGSKYGSVGP